MKNLRTAPQILEHYYPKEWRDYYFQDELVLKAMRFYAKYKSDIAVKKEREKIKDELYEEARENVLIQYNLK